MDGLICGVHVLRPALKPLVADVEMLAAVQSSYHAFAL